MELCDNSISHIYGRERGKKSDSNSRERPFNRSIAGKGRSSTSAFFRFRSFFKAPRVRENQGCLSPLILPPPLNPRNKRKEEGTHTNTRSSDTFPIAWWHREAKKCFNFCMIRLPAICNETVYLQFWIKSYLGHPVFLYVIPPIIGFAIGRHCFGGPFLPLLLLPFLKGRVSVSGIWAQPVRHRGIYKAASTDNDFPRIFFINGFLKTHKT